MVQVRAFLIAVCFIWVLFDEGHGDVQIYNREKDGDGPRNISVNIHGPNGGNICIDCQNQIQLDAGLETDASLSNLADLERYLGPNSRIPHFFYLPSQEKPNMNSMVVTANNEANSENIVPLTYAIAADTKSDIESEVQSNPLIYQYNEHRIESSTQIPNIIVPFFRSESQNQSEALPMQS